MSLGCVMVDLRGPRMGAGERELLAHPAVGGVILFSRNFESPAQLRELCKEVHAVRSPHLLLSLCLRGQALRLRERHTTWTCRFSGQQISYRATVTVAIFGSTPPPHGLC